MKTESIIYLISMIGLLYVCVMLTKFTLTLNYWFTLPLLLGICALYQMTKIFVISMKGEEK